MVKPSHQLQHWGYSHCLWQEPGNFENEATCTHQHNGKMSSLQYSHYVFWKVIFFVFFRFLTLAAPCTIFGLLRLWGGGLTLMEASLSLCFSVFWGLWSCPSFFVTCGAVHVLLISVLQVLLLVLFTVLVLSGSNMLVWSTEPLACREVGPFNNSLSFCVPWGSLSPFPAPGEPCLLDSSPCKFSGIWIYCAWIFTFRGIVQAFLFFRYRYNRYYRYDVC